MGLPITLGWGTGRVRCNLIWYNDFTALPQTTKSGGKGGGVKQTTYTYTASIIMGLCAGEVVDIPTVYRDKDVFQNSKIATSWDGYDYEFTSQTAIQQAGLNLATGTTSQMPWGYVTSMHPDQALAYRGLAYVYAQDYPLNDNAAIPNHSFEVEFSIRVAGKQDANPKDITVDLLTNPVHGLPGWSSGLIGDLTLWSDYCLANGLLISPVLDTARPARDLINEWCEITNSAAFWSEGKLKVGTYGDASATGNGVTFTPDLTPIYALTEDDFIPIDDYIPVSIEIRNQSDAYNIVQVEFLDRSNQYNVAVSPSQDLANINEYGKRKQDPVNWHAICDASVARLSSQLLLQRTLYRRELYTFKLAWNYVVLDPMDYVSLTTTTDQLKLDNKLVQIISIEENEDDCLTFIAEAVNVGSGSSPKYSAYTGDAISVQTQMTPVAVSPPVLVNAPSSLTGLDPEVWVAVAGANPNWGGCEVWISADDISYQRVGVITAPAKIGKSTALLPDSTDPDTTNTLSVNMSLSGQDLLSSSAANANSGSTLFVLGDEIMAYQTATLTSTNNYNLTTLRRGLYGTAHTAHSSNSNFARLDEAVFKISYTDLNFGEVMYIKLPSFNSFGLTVEDLSTVTPYSITLLNSTEAVDWRVVADQKSISGFLTNESHTVASASDGTGYSLTTAGGLFKVYNGDTDVSLEATFSVLGISTKNGLTMSIDSLGAYSLSGTSWTSDSETFTLQAVYNGVTIQKEYSIAKSKAGVNGSGGPLLFLSSTAQTFTYDGTGAASPSSQTVTFTANLQNATGDVTFVATGYTATGTSLGPITLSGTGDTRTMSNTQFGSAAYAVVVASYDTVSDTVTVVRLKDGAAGSPGTPGANGLNSASVFLYKRATSTPAVPSTTLTYTFATGVLSGTLDGWTQSVPSGTDPIYVTLATASSTSSTDTIPTGEWASPAILAQNGTNGSPGAPGTNGLNNAIVYLYQRAASAPSAPSGTFTYTFATGVLSGGTPGSWTQTIPAVNGNPLWVIAATASSNTATDSIAASEFTSPTKLVQDGDPGTPGSNGLNSASVFLYKRATSTPAVPSTTLTYTFSTGLLSGTLDGWTQTIPSGTDPIYVTLATAASTSSTDTIGTGEWATPTVLAQNGTNGSPGTNGLNNAIVYLYQRAASSPAAPSGTFTYTFATGVLSGGTPGSWTQTIPAVNGNPLWVIAATASSNTATDTIAASEFTSPTTLAQDGAPGSNGLNSASVFLYKRATSTPAVPSTTTTYTFATGVLSGTLDGWTQSVPSGTDPVYVTLATAASTSSTDTVLTSEWASPTVLAQNGTNGSPGTNGLNNAIVYLYQRASSAPSAPSGTFTYTFATGVLSGGTPGSWTQTIPAVNGSPLWVIAATASSNTATDTIAAAEFTSPTTLAQDGAPGSNGLNSASVFLYKRATSTPAVPSTTLTYTFSTGLLSGTLDGWTQAVPSGTDPVYVTLATAASTSSTDTIPTSEWASPTILAQNGTPGSNGLNNAIVYLYQRAASSPTAPSGTFTYTFATGVLSGGTPGSWTQAIPAVNGNPLWVIAATASSNTATDTIAASEFSSPTTLAQDGAPGSPGANGLNSASVFIYKRATSTPAVPSTTLTYTFSTGLLSGTLDGWTQAVPSGTDPVYVSTATAASTSSTDTIPTSEWASPNVLAQNGTPGTNGLNNAMVYLYQRAASTPSAPLGTFTYTFSTGVLSGGTPGSWTQTIPATNGNPLWVIAATASSNTATDTIAAAEFTSPTTLVQDGTPGSPGSPGTSAVGVNLTNTAVQLFAYADGSVPSYANATGQVKVYNGATDVTASSTFSATPSTGVTGTVNSSGAYSVTAMTVNNGTLTITATYAGVAYTRVFTVSKLLTGYEIVSALPTTNLFEGRMVYLESSNKLYRNIDGTFAGWTVEVDGADIKAGTVTAAKMNVTQLSAITATIGTLRTATTGARTEISDNVIKVYDAANTLRVKIGDLSL